MAKCALLFLLIFISVDLAKAQTSEVMKGKVIDYNSSLPLASATIEVYKNKEVIQIAKTDSLGLFYLSTDKYKQHTSLRISQLNYHSLDVHRNQKSFDENEKQRKKDLGIFELNSKAIELKEVVIKRNKRYRDTTVIDLSNENFERSIMIDNLFSQKGFYKDANGKLFYKGKPVSEVLVNGGDFFGKNNLSIYDKLPALVLKNIEVVETDIDSITQITLIRPTVKVNLNLKSAYQKGKFGNGAPGIGSRQRYFLATDNFSYRKKEQISLSAGVNNIDNPINLPEPIIRFSAMGNNTRRKFAKLTYSNAKKKLEYGLSGMVKKEEKEFMSNSERTEEVIRQTSITKTTTASSSFMIEDLSTNLIYKIDSANKLKFRNTINYNQTTTIDTSDYDFESESLKTSLYLRRKKDVHSTSVLNTINYEHFFPEKKGRILGFDIFSKINTYRNTEINNLEKDSSGTPRIERITGWRKASEVLSKMESYLIEPLGITSYLRFNGSYRNENLKFKTEISPVYAENLPPGQNELAMGYWTTGVLYHKTFDKVALEGSFDGILNSRAFNSKKANPLFNMDINTKLEYRVNNKNTLILNYGIKPGYPTSDQLTNFNGSFDISSMMIGNINLKPEIKHFFTASYSVEKSEVTNYSITFGLNRYYQKHGINASTGNNFAQYYFFDNIGSSSAANFAFLLRKSLKTSQQLYNRISLDYNESPTKVNEKVSLTKGLNISNTFTLNQSFLNNDISLSSSVSAQYNRYIYENGITNQINFTYSDQVAINLLGLRLINSPIINYSQTKNRSNFTAALNLEIKKSILKNYGSVWIKGYDIFNSFRYDNNLFSSYYTQTIKYNNLKNYFLIGFNYKFNNLK
ncbi:outer membrane beta-barrel protein [Pedobacter africanus]|uniref:Outer membrane protein beta-barrel family protein n=1 Tax=Pedobacter africanus TaxID=151894 RepID=A0A1W2BBL1_9SPHI|nr:outer membrane beta-barrel protein [Pedobacter africanus]SMC70377.1 Outer membrane protein beta-barrel family protein [Pedobacter africanus]